MECVSRYKRTYPKISVIIPMYKVESFIGSCARSLFEQTLNDIEYIFVDDNSPDASVDVLLSIIKEYPNREGDVIIISNNQNIGPSASRNVGLERSTGEYVAFCDSDDEVKQNAYELMLIEAIEKNADIVSCGVVVEEDGMSQVRNFDSWHHLSHDSLFQYHCLEGILWSSLWNKLFRKGFLSKYDIKFCDTLRMWDDLYFTFTARFFCESDAIVNLPLYHYVLKKFGSITKEDILVKASSQIECVVKLETFLKLQKADDMSSTLTFLKLRSKDDLFCYENREQWRSIYPESHREMYKYLSFYGLKRIILFYLYAYSNIGVVSKILDFYSKLKGAK